MAANDLLDGYVYFLESDAVRNQNWLADMTAINLAVNFTEGTDYCKIKLPKQWVKRFGTGITIDDASGGKSFMERSSQKSYTCEITGYEVAGSAVNLIESFFMDADHTASSITTFKHYYMIIRRSVTDYEKFTDNNDARKDYCHGAALSCEIVWNETKSILATVKISFRSAWGSI